MAQALSKLKDVNILLGVSGAIPVYKAADLASKLTSAGAKVRCVMTDSATKLVTPRTFQALTGMDVHTDLWTDPKDFSITHIKLADAADIVVVVPATANTIGKIANGICDDLLSTTLCACWEKPFLIAPAMNTQMWANPAVRQNIETLKNRQIEIIGPETGRLACGTQGPGRMTEPADIIKRIEQIAEQI